MIVGWAMSVGTVCALWGMRLASRKVGHKRDAPDRALADRVARLEQQVGDELRGFEERLLELEERQDFAERLLTRGAQGERPHAEH